MTTQVVDIPAQIKEMVDQVTDAIGIIEKLAQLSSALNDHDFMTAYCDEDEAVSNVRSSVNDMNNAWKRALTKRYKPSADGNGGNSDQMRLPLDGGSMEGGEDLRDFPSAADTPETIADARRRRDGGGS